jgi:hypothetical protein
LKRIKLSGALGEFGKAIRATGVLQRSPRSCSVAQAIGLRIKFINFGGFMKKIIIMILCIFLHKCSKGENIGTEDIDCNNLQDTSEGFDVVEIANPSCYFHEAYKVCLYVDTSVTPPSEYTYLDVTEKKWHVGALDPSLPWYDDPLVKVWRAEISHVGNSHVKPTNPFDSSKPPIKVGENNVLDCPLNPCGIPCNNPDIHLVLAVILQGTGEVASYLWISVSETSCMIEIKDGYFYYGLRKFDDGYLRIVRLTVIEKT